MWVGQQRTPSALFGQTATPKSVLCADHEVTRKDCGVLVTRLQGKSWAPTPGTTAKSDHSLRTARSAARLHAHVRSAAAMLVAPSIRSRPIAVFRRVAITRGAFPVLMVDASSR